ncbi:zinc finger protein 568-like [Penaeus monodon]|uniref:zinc finger protein 568-like n=1 Tax=Penaeus monodon TaxID=6687 RepID=UPI0018A709B7|nr:zinc finger protein 568-like [Penaeus monodon]
MRELRSGQEKRKARVDITFYCRTKRLLTVQAANIRSGGKFKLKEIRSHRQTNCRRPNCVNGHKSFWCNWVKNKEKCSEEPRETKRPFPGVSCLHCCAGKYACSQAAAGRVMMSFLGDGMPSAPFTGKEIVGTGVRVKEELSEDVTEDTCLEIKEEPLDYGDEPRNEVCNKNVIRENLLLHNPLDLRYESYAKYSCNLVQDGNAMSKVPFGVKDCGKTCSSDEVQVMYEERLKEDTQLKLESTRKCFACQVCGKELSKESHIRIHMRVHTKEKPYNFDICNKTFPSKSDLERHESCEICNNTFSWKKNLLRHMRTHTKEKPYSCEICNKAFSERGNLVAHIRVHTKEKPYCCEICNKAFSYKGSLEIHMRRHRKEKTYSCEICNKAFYLKSHVVTHMRTNTRHRDESMMSKGLLLMYF